MSNKKPRSKGFIFYNEEWNLSEVKTFTKCGKGLCNCISSCKKKEKIKELKQNQD